MAALGAQVLRASPAVAGTHAVSSRRLLTLSLLTNGKPQVMSTPSGDAFFSLDVPAGTVPAEFVARLLVRGPVTSGIATVTTPTSVYPEDLTTVKGTSTITAPLQASDVVDGVVAIHVNVDLNLNVAFANPSGCTPASSTVAEITSAVGHLDGTLVTPSTPANFWPPSLQRVTVWVPPLATLTPANAQDVSLASLQVSATVAQQYGSNTRVSVAEGTPPPHAFNVQTRDVAIKVTTHGPSHIGVETAGTAPVLVVAGEGRALDQAAKTISASGLALATAPRATHVAATLRGGNPAQVRVTANGTREITLAELGVPTTLEGLGTVDVTQPLSQAQFGAPISNLQLRLQANYTPPPLGGVATFTALVGGYIVGSQRLSAAGSLSIDASVPTSVLARTQTVTFELDYSPPGGFCHAGLVPVQVTINPASGFAARSGQSLPPGFGRSPQDLASGIDVALMTRDNATLVAACQLVASLSQLLFAQPVVHLVPASQVAKGTTTELVVGGSPAAANELQPPLLLAAFRTTVSANATLGYTVDQGFAALEAFSQNGRDVILLSAYRQAGLAGLLARSLQAAPTGWFSLGTGQVATITSGQKLRLIATNELLPQVIGATPATGLGIPRWLIIGLFGALALILARVGWLGLRMLRLRRAAAAAGPSSGGGQLGGHRGPPVEHDADGDK
ncbi:MAG: cellulose biosynthesis cyclic di-GMP-binding regulatory protein BcsB [Acidimicrobiales bacterium]